MRSVPSYHFHFFAPQKTSDPVLVKCSRAQHRRLHLRASPPTCSPARLQSRNQLLPRSLRSSSTNASLGLARTVPTSVETSRSRAPTNGASAPSHTVRFRTKVRVLVCPGHSRADRALSVLATRAHAARPALWLKPRNPRGVGSAARPSRACPLLPSFSSTSGAAASRAYSPCIFSRAALLCRAEQATRFRGERQRRDYDKLAVTLTMTGPRFGIVDPPSLRINCEPPSLSANCEALLSLRVNCSPPLAYTYAYADADGQRAAHAGRHELEREATPVVYSRLRAPGRSQTTKSAGTGGREAEAIARARCPTFSPSLPL
ncbi:hypothetical protein K438DRAFT_1985975 [Mycena galopus ATCC 62051]|nr:hypothetical protein K438DRAFT_1985975 [Mycena galopus ATCC 62051]